MDSIYLNNFRGITDTVIPIFNVNFFVGENSTGKSSVLNALALLSSPEFWFKMNFNSSEYEFGGYKDIVSISSDDKSEFQIGLYKDKDENEKINSSCYMVHFREGRNGLPVLSRFSKLCMNYFVTIKITSNGASIYGTKDVPTCTDGFNLGCCFEFLKNIPSTHTKGYKKISGELRKFIKNNIIALFPVVLEKYFPDLENDEDGFIPFPALSKQFATMAPIRTKPKRTYDGYAQRYSPEGEHTPYIIRSRIGRKGSPDFRESLELFGKESGLFSSISVSQYGKDKSAPFELIVNLSENSPLRINSVGYGVSQALPVVVELINRPKNTWFTVQQPEVHLHPRAQAALGDVFFEVASNDDKIIFIETHSDYLIDRFRMNYRTSNPGETFAQILFFERHTIGNKITRIEILDSGDYPDDQPEGFRSFFLEEERKILGI